MTGLGDFPPGQGVDYRGFAVAAAAGQEQHRRAAFFDELAQLGERGAHQGGLDPLPQPLSQRRGNAFEELVDIIDQELEAISVYGHRSSALAGNRLS